MKRLDKQQILADLKERQKNSPNFKHEWQELGHEMSNKFGRQMYFLFYRYPENKIREAYKKCSEKGVYKISHLIENIKEL